MSTTTSAVTNTTTSITISRDSSKRKYPSKQLGLYKGSKGACYYEIFVLFDVLTVRNFDNDIQTV